MVHAKSNVRGSDYDVVIVGGGLAGLTTAMGLRKAGLRIAVIESEPILGGRARSWTDKTTGDPIHIGPHIFLSHYPNMFQLLDQLGTRDKIIWQLDKFLLKVDGQESFATRMAPLPAPLNFFPSVLKDPSLSYADVLSGIPVSSLAIHLTEADILALDDFNALSVLKTLGVTDNMIRSFWAFTAMAIMNVPLELCSAGALLRFYRRLIGHSKYYAGFPDGGLGDLFAPQAKAMLEEAGVDFLMSTRVKCITADGDQVRGVQLTDGRHIAANYVIATLPPTELGQILPLEWTRKHKVFRDLVHFHPSPYLSTYLWFDRKLTKETFWARTYDPNDLNCDFYDLSNINRGWEDRPSLITTNCIFCHRANHLTDDEVIARTVDELADYLPEAREAKLVHAVVNRIPMAIHCPHPGTEKLRAPTKTPVRNLLLAGDWIRTELPSCMESACMAGWRAAEIILGDVGKPEPLVVPHQDLDGIAGALSRATRWIPRPRLRGLADLLRR